MVLGLMGRIFGVPRDTTAPATPPARDNCRTPPEEAAPVRCREAILDRGQRLVGYQFTHHRGPRSRAEHHGRSIRHIYAGVQVRSLDELSAGNGRVSRC